LISSTKKTVKHYETMKWSRIKNCGIKYWEQDILLALILNLNGNNLVSIDY